MNMSRSSLLRIGTGLAALLVTLPACSASVSTGGDLNTDRAEEVIAEGILDQTGTDVTVRCPDDVAIEQDNTFDCTARGSDGTESTVEVTQTDDEGNIEWRLQ
jgi:hypothetical protein